MLTGEELRTLFLQSIAMYFKPCKLLEGTHIILYRCQFAVGYKMILHENGKCESGCTLTMNAKTMTASINLAFATQI